MRSYSSNALTQNIKIFLLVLGIILLASSFPDHLRSMFAAAAFSCSIITAGLPFLLGS